MAVWIKGNLGLDRKMEIDRIDNDGDYAPGNLRLATRAIQSNNTRRERISVKARKFLSAHPEIRYSHGTLKRLLLKGMSAGQIIRRHATPGTRPRGPYKGRSGYAYTMSSMQARDIALLRTGS
jgi:hypothetical protein